MILRRAHEKPSCRSDYQISSFAAMIVARKLSIIKISYNFGEDKSSDKISWQEKTIFLCSQYQIGPLSVR